MNETKKSCNQVVARVINEEKEIYKVLIDGIIFTAVISKKFLKSALVRIDYPAVGDYVYIESKEGYQHKIITEIKPRKTLLTRKQVGTISDAQVLASNIDVAFIATSLNQEFSLGRIERYLSFVYESGAQPILLLTKSDLMSEKDIEKLVGKMKERFPKLTYYLLNCFEFSKTTVFQETLTEGVTAVILGSSGVGKSTLVNYLLADSTESISTQEVRAGDDKGRHTTTSRSLYRTKFGGDIIDTPGMRELQFLNHSCGLVIEYEDIEELISHCKFSNCQHNSELLCAINLAIESGSLDIGRFKNYKKLKSELLHAERRQSKFLMASQKAIWKKRSKLAREEFKANRR